MLITILDDHPIIRQGIEGVINTAMPEINTRTFETVSSLIEFTKNNHVDIAITDLSLNVESGLEYIRYVKAENLEVKCIVFTSSSEYRDYKNAMEMGAKAFVKKDSLPDDLLYAIRSVQRGRSYVDSYFIDHYENFVDLDKALTDRELDVFKCIGKGYDNAKIASELFITKNTVKKHIGNIFSKLDVKTRTEAVLAALDYFGGRPICQ